MDGEALLVTSTIIARFILGGVFLWAGIAKLRHLEDFQQAAADFDLVPRQVVSAMAPIIPPAEIGLGVLLILGLGTRWVATFALLMLVGFTVAVLIVLFRSQHSKCFCFGRPDDVVSGLTVYRNASLLLINILIVATPIVSPISLDAVISSGGHRFNFAAQEFVLTGLVFIAIALVWIGLYEAIRNLRIEVTQRKALLD